MSITRLITAFKRSMLTCFVCCAAAHAALDIEVTRATDAAMPIAIVPFAGAEQAPTAVSTVISQDLARSGEFKPLDPMQMAQKPSDPAQVDFSYWRRIQMDAVVVGRVQPLGGGQYQIEATLFDLYTPQGSTSPLYGPRPAFTEKMVVNERQLRSAAHHLADKIYEKLTGHRGAFNTRIAYVNVQWQGGKIHEYRLEIADSDGHNPQPLLRSSQPIMSPAWSPDGRELAYVSFENHRAQIYIANIATGQRRLVSKEQGINGAPAWSPDGTKLALVLSRQAVAKIYLLDVRSGQVEALTTGPSIDTEPSFSPDGAFIYYTSNRGGQPQIYRVNIYNKMISRVTFEGDYNARARPTSDGRYLIMIHRELGRYQIAAQDLKNQQLLVLTQTQLDQSPSLAPNDRMIIYSTLSNNRRVLSACSIDGRVRLLIPTQDGEVQDPAWSPYLRNG